MNPGRGAHAHTILKGWGSVPKKPMVSVYINNTWVHQQGDHWIAKAVTFSENDNDVTSPLAMTLPS